MKLKQYFEIIALNGKVLVRLELKKPNIKSQVKHELRGLPSQVPTASA